MAAQRKKSKRAGPYRHRRWGNKQVQELAEISAVLEQRGELDSLAEDDLRGASVAGSGPESMTARQVLRAFIIKDMNDYDWMMLEWQLVNLESYRRFCGTEDMFPEYFRIPTLQLHLGSLRPETIARLHEVLTEARADRDRE